MLSPLDSIPTFEFLNWPEADKLVHGTSFAILGMLSVSSLGESQQRFILILIIWSVYAMMVEIFQFYIPGRSFEILDILADVIGAIVGYFAFIQFNNIKQGNL